MTKPLEVGDLCITVNSAHPAANDGTLVVIVGINHSILSKAGESCPYFIRRIDGGVFTSSTNRFTGELNWGKCSTVWTQAYKLRRIDPTQDPADTEATRRAVLEGL